MSFYKVSPLALTFGSVIDANGTQDLPDREAFMNLFVCGGAILLRGFPHRTDSFVKFSDSCCATFSKYVGGGARFRALDRISRGAEGTLLTTTGNESGFSMPLHGEMYYQKMRPDMLWFYCERPPMVKGQTTLADGRELFSRLSERSKALLRSTRLLYRRDLSPADWQTMFKTESPDELHQICEANEMTLEVRSDDSIVIEYVTPAIRPAHSDGEIFINNAMLLVKSELAFRNGEAAPFVGTATAKVPLVVRLEDGSVLPEWLIADIDEVSEEITIEVQWQRGDILAVDNRRILHGRRKTVGDREILVRLGNLREASTAA
jgi:alpha-ketoglutarate-dependent taurine dioxygenase